MLRGTHQNDEAAPLKQKATLFHTTCNWNVAFITMVRVLPLHEVKIAMNSSCFHSLPMPQGNFIHTTSRYLHYMWHDLPPLLVNSSGSRACCDFTWPSMGQSWSMLEGYCKDAHSATGKVVLASWINRNFHLLGLWIKTCSLKRL